MVATGETHSIKELVEIAFSAVGLDWRDHGVVDPALIRPAEVDLLTGDASKARVTLGWEPTMKVQELVRLMVEADLSRYAGQ